MEEDTWRAQLAKSNINILDIHDNMAFVEFTYHPSGRSSTFKWCKTVFPFQEGMHVSSLSKGLQDRILELRKELEQ